MAWKESSATTPRRAVVSLLVAGLTLGAGACGDRPPTAISSALGRTGVYECHGLRTTLADLADAPLVADLDHAGLPMFTSVTDSLDGWRAVAFDDGYLAALRELDAPVIDVPAQPGYERLTVTLIDADALADSHVDRWEVSSAGPCPLRADLGDLQAADVFLPDDDPGDPTRSVLDLLVVETECATGRTAHGRVETVVETTSDEVRLVVGVRRLDGDQACPGNPPTPVTIELGEPLGDRRIVDAARHPVREISPYPGS
jgi:hypothetical protein